jgi:Mrp family chromosome partitioning ATPase
MAHVLQLSESAECEEGGIEGKIAKYQPLDRFFARLVSVYASMQRGGLDAETEPSSCRTTAVYSAAGGAGKTTVAMNLAKHLAEQGRRVIVLNLESLGSVSAFIAEAPGDRFSRLMYCLRSDPKRLAAPK